MRLNSGARDSVAMSSSSAIVAGLSGQQLVAARIGYQEERVGGVRLHLLAQTIDGGLERVRRDVGVVAPHLGEQHVAADDLLPGPVEKAQDRGLFLGELELRALLADEELRARSECVGADLKDRVFARFVLPELRPDAGKEDGELERLDHVIVGAGL